MEFHSRTTGALLEKEVMPYVGRTDRRVPNRPTTPFVSEMSGYVASRLGGTDLPTLFRTGTSGPRHHKTQMEGRETLLPFLLKGPGGRC